MEKNRLETSLRTEPQVYRFVPTSGMAALAGEAAEKVNVMELGCGPECRGQGASEWGRDSSRLNDGGR